MHPSVTLLAMKDSDLRTRIERKVREKFLAKCREQDRIAVQVPYRTMRALVADIHQGMHLGDRKGGNCE